MNTRIEGTSVSTEVGDTSDRRHAKSRWQWPVLIATLLSVLAGGWWIAQWRGELVDHELRALLLAQTQAIAATIDHDTVRALSFTEADRDNPQFQRLRAQMRLYAGYMNHRSLYSMALRDGHIVFGPENLAADDPWASAPGTVYEQPTVELQDSFRTGRAFTEGPVVDEYGIFVSALAPVIDPHTDEVLMMVGLDVAAEQWDRHILRVRLIPLASTLILATILLGGGIVLNWRDRHAGERHERLRHTEAVLTAIFGLVLTFTIALLTHDAETRTRQLQFSELAAARTALVRETFRVIETHQLATFARFFEASDEVTREEFRRFAGTFNRDGHLLAIAWVPMHDTGYPIRYVEPMADHAELIGFDLAADPEHRAALERATHNRLITVTDGPLPGLSAASPNMLQVVQPVNPSHATTSGTPAPQGFLLAVLAPNALVQMVSKTLEQHPAILARLHRLNTGLAGSRPGCTAEIMATIHIGEFPCGVFPLFLFDTVHALLIQAGPGFTGFLSNRVDWTNGLAGLLLTGLMTLLVGFLNNRRSELQRQVSIHTATLRASEARLRTSEERLQLALGGANLGLWDWHFPSGRVIYNQRLAEMLGYRLEEIEPHASTWEKLVHPEDWPGVWARFETHLRGETPRFESEHRLRHKDGHWVWVLDRGTVMERAADGTPIRAAGTHLDISRRKMAEAELERLASTDPLTELPNRRQFIACLHHELTRLDRFDGPVALLMIDLDHFKQINDTYGHATGDTVLRHFADLLRAAARKADSIGRLGGEEFALLLPGSDRDGALLFVHRLRDNLEQSPAQTDPGPIDFTFSVGIALLTAADRTPEPPLARADQALYRAKRRGRDRVEFQA